MENLIGTFELSCLASALSLCETIIIIDTCDRREHCRSRENLKVDYTARNFYVRIRTNFLSCVNKIEALIVWRVACKRKS